MVTLKSAPGEKIKLTAKGTCDPDQNQVSYRWFLYKEAGRYQGNVALSNADTDQIELEVPTLPAGQSLYLICRVKDNGTPALYSYRRIIISR